MNNCFVKKNSLKAWLLASRPQTLTGASVPVAIGLAMVYNDASWFFLKTPAVLCFLFAFVMQIDANFINDFFDYIKGADDDTRLGPKRACSEGWVSLGAMKKAIALTTVAACIIGLPLVFWGGMEMIVVGILCVLFCFLYTTHLSYMGLGDLLVLLFFGIVPVCFTYYVQLHVFTFRLLTVSVACGLVVDTLLVVNNYRDRHTDRLAGKRTLITRIGDQYARFLYLGLGFAGVLLGFVHLQYGYPWAFGLPFLYLVPHYLTYRQMVIIDNGRELNRILGMTARNIFIYGILSVVGLLV